MSHTWMSHVTVTGTIMHESSMSAKWCVVMCRMHSEKKRGMSHGTYMNEPCHNYGYDYAWVEYVCVHAECIQINKKWEYALTMRTYKWVMSHMCMSHVTHTMMKESWVYACVQNAFQTKGGEYALTMRTHEWVTSHFCMSHVIRWWMSRVCLRACRMHSKKKEESTHRRWISSPPSTCPK